MIDQSVLDYSTAMVVASALVGLLVNALPAGRKPSDALLRMLLFVVNVAALVYVAWALGDLHLQQQILTFAAIALGIPVGGHVLYKTQAGQTPTAAPQNAVESPSVAPTTLDVSTLASAIQQAAGASTAAQTAS